MKPRTVSFQRGEDDTARANVSVSNVFQTSPQVDGLEARGVHVPRYISFDEKNEFEKKLTSVTCMHANVLELRAVGVPDYAREKSNLETDLFSLGLVNMHALQRAHIRVHKGRVDMLQVRTCASVQGIKVHYFFMFPRPPENRSKAMKLLPRELLCLCASGWGPLVVYTYPAALQIKRKD